MLLRAQVVRAERADYYVHDLRPDGVGRPAGESAGLWWGQGSVRLGLRGEPERDALAAVLSGLDPLGDRPLRANRGERAAGGVDLVWCAPKSVSVLHLLGPPELGTATEDAHRAAVAEAAAYLEREAIGVRRTTGGIVRHLPGQGAVAAAFLHRTSRALDPHLHTHLVVANVAQGPDGLWSAVDTRRLFAHVRAASALYDGHLRHEMTQRASIGWERRSSGRWEIDGIDPVLCRTFSQRAASMDEHLHRMPVARSARGTIRAAFHSDRPDKDARVAMDELRYSWRKRADDLGIDLTNMVEVIGRAHRHPTDADVQGDLSSDVAEHNGVSLPATKRRLLATVADEARQGLPVHLVEERVAMAVGVSPRGIERMAGGGRDIGRYVMPESARTQVGLDPFSSLSRRDQRLGREVGGR